MQRKNFTLCAVATLYNSYIYLYAGQLILLAWPAGCEECDKQLEALHYWYIRAVV